MTRTNMASALALAALLATALGAAPSALHVRLTRSDPADHATLRAAPHAISLWFSESVQLSVTSVHLTGPGGTAVELAAPRMGEGQHAPVIVDVKGPVAPGVQQVTWRTMARDGHAANGTLTFTLAPAAPATERHR
ncbi:MAG: copper resistance protein CopC [Gemmatimonadales bacterium]